MSSRRDPPTPVNVNCEEYRINRAYELHYMLRRQVVIARMALDEIIEFGNEYARAHAREAIKAMEAAMKDVREKVR